MSISKQLEEFQDKMDEIESEHEHYFTEKEKEYLQNKKEEFANNVIFWCNANVPEAEAIARIKWEYNNIFDILVEVINNNVDEYNEEINKEEL